MTAPDLTRRLAARKLAAARLATDLILDCERAASGRNGKRADPARWTETDWRSYIRVASRSPATSRLALRGRPSRPLTLSRRRAESLVVAFIPNS